LRYWLAQALLVWTIAIAVGAEFTGSLPLAILIILLSIAAYVGLGFILGTQLARRTEDVNALVAAFGVPLLLLGGAFLPIRLFPDSLLSLAEYNPVYHMILALQAAVDSAEGQEAIAPHLTFLVGFAGCHGDRWLGSLSTNAASRTPALNPTFFPDKISSLETVAYLSLST
jgi:ABC-2 type transport system permease protein